MPVGAATTDCDAAGCDAAGWDAAGWDAAGWDAAGRGVAVAVEGVVEGVIDSEVTVAAAD
ncbi:MAG: hypothetical protein ACK54X_24835 [Burkholderiales bacterium]